MASPTFGGWLREQREQRRLTASEAARKSGMLIQQWSRMEADEPKRKDGSPSVPTKETLEKIARGLSVPLAEVKRAFRAAYADETDSADADRPVWEAYYNELPETVQEDVAAQIEALWKRHRREQTTHGKKAETEEEAE